MASTLSLLAAGFAPENGEDRPEIRTGAFRSLMNRPAGGTLAEFGAPLFADPGESRGVFPRPSSTEIAEAHYAPSPIPVQEEDVPQDDRSAPALLLTAPRTMQPPLPGAVNTASRITTKGPVENVNITFYDCADQGFCGRMYNGDWVYEGAAACSWNLPLGAAFYLEDDPTRRIYVCKDRGLLDDTWVDIFWNYPDDGWDWQASVGRYGTIHIVYLPF